MNFKDFLPYGIKKAYRKHKIKRTYGPDCRIDTNEIGANVSIGQGVHVAKNVSIRKNAKIGDYSYSSSGTTIFDGTTIGRYCSIGYGVQIGPYEHPVSFITTSPRIYRETTGVAEICGWPSDDVIKPVEIHNNVWVGSKATILQGVKIGEGAVIAAGAVVTKNVGPYEVWGGVPARFIKYRMKYESIEKILSDDIFSHDPKWIEDYIVKYYGGQNENSSFSTD